MSRVVVATAFGGPEVLSVADAPVGPAGPGEVLLTVRAAGVNPIDTKLYGGAFGSDPSKLPMRLGFEASGVVAAVGEGARGPAGPVSVGDEVIAFRISGAYAEQVLVDAGSVVPKPPALTWEEAAGLMLTGATAVHALTATDVGRGDTVLVHAASGGVGLMTVQLAGIRGARVVGTASERRHDLVREFGGEPVAYGDGLAARVRVLTPDGVDAAIDAVGTDEAIDASLSLVEDRDRIATIAAFERGSREGINVLGSGPGGDPGEEIRNEARLALLRHVEEGGLRVLVSRSYPLAEVAQAHRAVLEGHTHGKVVLVP